MAKNLGRPRCTAPFKYCQEIYYTTICVSKNAVGSHDRNKDIFGEHFFGEKNFGTHFIFFEKFHF